MWKALTFYQIGAVLHDLIMKRPIFQDEVLTENRYVVAAAVLHKKPHIFNANVAYDLISLARDCLLKCDKERLNRVSWDRFKLDKLNDTVELRRRLGLNPQSSVNQKETERRSAQDELLKVNFEIVKDQVIELTKHVLRKANFPPTAVRENSIEYCDREFSRLVFSFTPTFEHSKAIEFHFVVYYWCSYDRSVELRIAAALSKDNCDVQDDFVQNRILTIKIDDFDRESSQIFDWLTEQFITLYSVGYEQTMLFETCDDSFIFLPFSLA